ncbi:MAG: hypothetical protein ABFS34_07175 [Gemmatimonadota bacterium]
MSKDSPPPAGEGSLPDASGGDDAPERRDAAGSPFVDLTPAIRPEEPGRRHPFDHLPRVLLPLPADDEAPLGSGPVPAAPWPLDKPRRRRWPRYAAIAAVVLGFGAAAVLVGGGFEGDPLAGSLEPGAVIPTDPRGLPVVAAPGDATDAPEAVADSASPTAPAEGVDLVAATLRASGSAQSVAPGTRLADSVAVRVLDGGGRPVPGVLVAFIPAEGSGGVSPTSSRTDATGLARASWRLGARAGGQTLVARLGDDGRREVIFRAFAVAPALAAAEPQAVASPGPAGGDPTQGPEGSEARPTAAASAALAVRPGLVPGGTFTCRVGEDGDLRCWGDDTSGQLGRQLADGLRFATAAAGVRHACALTDAGDAYCWGSNGNGQLGASRTGAALDGRKVESPVPLRLIAAGLGHNCAVGIDSRGYCWGGNDTGQLGVGGLDDRSAPSVVSSEVRFGAISAGWLHTCALSLEGAAYCWGRNRYGQVGDGSTATRTRPRAVAGGLHFGALATGSDHSCGLASNGVVHCWGRNHSGQLGTGDMADRDAPQAVSAEVSFRAIASGGVHVCGLSGDGVAYCWGSNAYGQLGDGTTEPRVEPKRVSGDLRFRQLWAAGAHTCALATDGRQYCWGYNRHGQLGDRSRDNRSTPTRVSGRP